MCHVCPMSPGRASAARRAGSARRGGSRRGIRIRYSSEPGTTRGMRQGRRWTRDSRHAHAARTQLLARTSRVGARIGAGRAARGCGAGRAEIVSGLTRHVTRRALNPLATTNYIAIVVAGQNHTGLRYEVGVGLKAAKTGLSVHMGTLAPIVPAHRVAPLMRAEGHVKAQRQDVAVFTGAWRRDHHLA
jgi:hypothetical protein